MERRSWRLGPNTASGAWSVVLIVAMPVLFLVGRWLVDAAYPSTPAGDTLLQDIVARPALALSMLAGMGAGVAAFLTGLWALLRVGERALLVVASTAIGALLVAFLVAEVAFPH